MTLPKLKNASPIVFTIFGVGLLVTFYFFIYLPKNERNLHEYSFRALQNIEENVHTKIDNHAALLNTMLVAAKGQFSEVSPVFSYVNQLDKNPSFSVKPVKEVNKASSDTLFKTQDSVFQIILDPSNSILHFTLSRNFKEVDKSLEITLQQSLEQFIGKLLPENIFDEYLVLSKNRVVLQSFQSGISKIIEDSVLKLTKGVEGAGVRPIEMGGKVYQAFFQPISFDNDNNDLWVVCGLVSQENFVAKKNKLPAGWVMFLITISMVIVLAFPWLRIYQMGARDRMTLYDGVWSMVVSMLLMSLLFMMLFKYNPRYRPKTTSDPKLKIAKAISKSFLNELQTALSVLDYCDSLYVTKPTFKQNKKLITNDSFWNEYAAQDSLKQLNIRQVYWLDHTGMELNNWTSEAVNAPLANFGKRAYFQQIKQQRGYSISTDKSQVFFIEQIISHTRNTFTTVISKKSGMTDESDNLFVSAMSIDVNSLKDAILPVGNSFAIINDGGKLLYHNDWRRNLNENLLSEFSNSEKLQSLIKGRVAGYLSTKYFGKEYLAYVEPIDQLPYYLVVLSDTGHIEARDFKIYSFTLSMLICMFLVVMVLLFIAFAVSARRSFFRKQAFNSSWVGPKISSASQYVVACWFHVWLILLLFIFFKCTEGFLDYLFILVFAIIYLSVLINSLYARRYCQQNNKPNLRYKLKTIFGMVVLLLLLNMAWLLKVETAFGDFHCFQITVILSHVAFYFWGHKLVPITRFFTDRLIKSNWAYLHGFTMMTLLRLVITSGIPVVLFYITSYNFEQSMLIRHKHIEYADALRNRFKNALEAKNAVFNRKGSFIDSAFINNVDTQTIPLKPKHYSAKEKKTIQILKNFRFYKSPFTIKNQDLDADTCTDKVIRFNNWFENARETGITQTYYGPSSVWGGLVFESSNLSYQSPSMRKDPIKGLYFWSGLLISLIIFYFILLQLIKQLYALHLPNSSLWKTMDKQLLENQDGNSRMFVIGLPGSGKLSTILDLVKEGKILGRGEENPVPLVIDKNHPEQGNVLVVDFIHLPLNPKENDEAWLKINKFIADNRYRLIIIHHFEYNIENPEANKIKLNFIESLMPRKDCKLIILSAVHPLAFFDSMHPPVGDPKKQPVSIPDVERWHVLLGHFMIVFQPLSANQYPADMESVKRMMMNETRYTHFLKKIRPVAEAMSQSNKDDWDDNIADTLAYKIQVVAHYFYMYIWQSLTNEEKFLLYDLAEDGLVNPSDSYNLSMLLNKGVIEKRDGTLHLFSKGFRNFILTAIGNTEAMKIKNTIKDSGNWTRLRTPLLMVLFALLAFLISSQQETYARIIGYVTALATGIPTILKMFSMFDRKETKVE